MTVLYLLPHLGLGDAIICNGMIRILATRHHRLVLPVKWHNRPSVAWMLNDLENVRILGVKDDVEAKSWANRFEYGGGRVLRLGVHGATPLRSDWDRQLYEQAGVDFEERWKGFRLPVTICYMISAAVSEAGNTPFLKTPAFLHEDIERGFVLDRRRNVPAVKAVSRMPTIWELAGWLCDAPEIHVIDSCFLCLADSIPTKGRLVFHRYARPGGLPPTLRKQWEVLT